MYKLTKIEEKELGNVWKFLYYFSNPPGKLSENWFNRNGKIFGAYDYREYIVNTVRNKYTYQEFYKYEKIINKLFWNLKKKMKPYIKGNKTKYKIVNTIKLGNVINNKRYGSTTNSYVHFNESDNKWYLLQKPSKLDLMCMNIMKDRKEYEKYYNNPSKKYKNIPKYYYYMNYPLPNINPMFYNKNKKAYWVKKIKKMYYTGSKKFIHGKSDKFWYELIIPEYIKRG